VRDIEDKQARRELRAKRRAARREFIGSWHDDRVIAAREAVAAARAAGIAAKEAFDESRGKPCWGNFHSCFKIESKLFRAWTATGKPISDAKDALAEVEKERNQWRIDSFVSHQRTTKGPAVKEKKRIRNRGDYLGSHHNAIFESSFTLASMYGEYGAEVDRKNPRPYIEEVKSFTSKNSVRMFRKSVPDPEVKKSADVSLYGGWLDDSFFLIYEHEPTAGRIYSDAILLRPQDANTDPLPEGKTASYRGGAVMRLLPEGRHTAYSRDGADTSNEEVYMGESFVELENSGRVDLGMVFANDAPHQHIHILNLHDKHMKWGEGTALSTHFFDSYYKYRSDGHRTEVVYAIDGKEVFPIWGSYVWVHLWENKDSSLGGALAEGYLNIYTRENPRITFALGAREEE